MRIVQSKVLAKTAGQVDAFVDGLATLGDKLGAILWQFERKLDRAQLVAERRQTVDEGIDLACGLRQQLRLHDAHRRLGREHETGRRLVAPPRVRRGLLRAVVSAVDLDRAQATARVFQFAPLHQAVREEIGAPRREGPPAHADADAVDRAGRRGQSEVGVLGAGGRHGKRVQTHHRGRVSGA